MRIRKFELNESRAGVFSDRLNETFSESVNSKIDESFKTTVNACIKTYQFKTCDYKFDLTLTELYGAIDGLKIRTAPGLDNIHNLLLKQTNFSFRKILLHIFNVSISTHSVPKHWKLSCISMIPKKISNSSDPKDYRPISLTSNIAKLSDRIILSRLL